MCFSPKIAYNPQNIRFWCPQAKFLKYHHMIMHLDMYFINEYMQYLKNSWLQLAEITIGLHCIVLSRHQYLHEGFLRVQLFRLQYGDQSNKLEHTCTTCKIAKRTCAFFTPSHIHIYTCQLLKVHLFLFLHSYMYKHWDT